MAVASVPALAASALARAALVAALAAPLAAEADEVVAAASAAPAEAPAAAAPAGGDAADVPTVLLEFGAYYTSAGIYLPLARDPVPHVGEHGEVDLYWAVLPRRLLPRFVVLEASVNPMPCLGLLVRDRGPGLYGRAQLDERTNLVRAVTAGFEEPWAVSLFVGNVVNFDVRGDQGAEGKGYFGTVLSAGTTHIKDNVAVDDPWLEAEVKLKGDRRSRVKKLSWSFRVGLKLHSNPDVVDAAYLGIRRSRTDYSGGPPLIANSGVEYRFDAATDGTPLRHYFIVDRKWPLGTRFAASIALGVLWDKGRSYRGALATDTPERVQVLVRPNFEF
jgi:hypothetical protein